MSFWFWHGLRRGIQSTRYPSVMETTPGVSPGRPTFTKFGSSIEAQQAEAECPVGAIVARGKTADVVLGQCIHCQRCHFGARSVMDWRNDYEWAETPSANQLYVPMPPAYRHSLHVIVVDAGDCGACLHEVKQLNNPLYNVHRLGIFFTPTPRAADVLLVVGPISENMRVPLLKTYEAMPTPKRVLAVGVCAINGGIFGRSAMSAGGVASMLPVDLEVPGDPPPPLAVLHGLLAITGRKTPETGPVVSR
jgi:Ni,Fe-hydrogenase III small subunit